MENGCDSESFRRVLEHIRGTLQEQRVEMDMILESAVRIVA